jgi:hypothetical protein
MTAINRDLASRVRAHVATVYGVEQPWTVNVTHGRWSTLDGRTGRWWIDRRNVRSRADQPAPTTGHAGRLAGPDCPACGPLLTAAQAAHAQRDSITASTGGRGSARYHAAVRADRAASRALLAAKQDHYRTS